MIERAEQMTGSKKAITEWWLQLIEEVTEQLIIACMKKQLTSTF